MRRPARSGLTFSIVLALATVLMGPSVASAQLSADVYLGAFVPHSLGSRDVNDVLLQDSSFLDFDMGSFTGFTFGGDFLVALGDKFDAGFGLGYYQRSVVAADSFSEFEDSGAPILATLQLRIVPFDATVRWLPLGHNHGVQPYVGGGVGVFAWHYSENGDFVANDNVTIIHGNFAGSGSAVGPVILGGVHVPVSRNLGIGGEIRYQAATGDLPSDQGFAGSTIDLGGFNYLFTMNFKF